MDISPSKLAIRIGGCYAALSLALLSSYAAAQSNAADTACSSPQAVLQRYVEAVGGETALQQVQSRMEEVQADFKTPAPFPFAGARRLSFKWKAPNKVAVSGRSSWTWPGATWRFDGKLWYSPNGANSRENTYRRFIQYQINMMYRLVADPLMIARAHEFYSTFEAADASQAHPGLCILYARRPDNSLHGIFDFESSGSCRDCLAPPRDTSLPDELHFDAHSGLLKAWKTHEGGIGRGYVLFEFDDYRETDAVKIPFWIHVEFGIFVGTFRIQRSSTISR